MVLECEPVALRLRSSHVSSSLLFVFSGDSPLSSSLSTLFAFVIRTRNRSCIVRGARPRDSRQRENKSSSRERRSRFPLKFPVPDRFAVPGFPIETRRAETKIRGSSERSMVSDPFLFNSTSQARCQDLFERNVELSGESSIAASSERWTRSH